MSFAVNITSDVNKLYKFMEDFERKHLSYAVSRSLNDVAVKSQTAICKRIPTIFNVTRKWWDKKQPLGIKVNFSNKIKLASSVYTRAYFAPLQEEGGIKRPQVSRSLAIPTSNVAKQDRNAKALRFLRGNPQIFRKNNAIYYRINRTNLMKLYTLSPQANIKPRFDFINTATNVFKNNYDKIFSKRFNEALRSAK